MGVEAENEEVVRLKREKKKHKKNKNREAISSSFIELPAGKEVGDKKEVKVLQSCEKEGKSHIVQEESGKDKKKQKKEKNLEDKEVGENQGTKRLEHWEESDKQKKKKEKRERKFKECNDVEYSKTKSADQVSAEGKKHIISNHIDVCSEENVEHKKKEKIKRKKKKNDNEVDSEEIRIDKSFGEGKTVLDHKEVTNNDCNSGSSTCKKRDREKEVLDVETGERKKKKKKERTELVKDFEKTKVGNGDSETGNRGGFTSDHSRDSEPKKSSKKVKFSGHVEVFPSSEVRDVGEETLEKNMVRGKRFSRKEDEMVKDAVHNYIELHNLGEKGVDMILHCRQYPEIKNCWKEIAAAIPWRPLDAIYARAHILFDRAESRDWTEDEKAFILKFHEKHGANWKAMAAALGKNRYHVKDTWRRIKLSQRKSGRWTQEEYQTLFDLVNTDLRMKIHAEKTSKHGMLRDNISWHAISTRLSTRTDMSCCNKWYDQLSSSMVKAGEWADIDDYRLLDELLRLDACCIEDVDWDNLLENRPGDICLKRWRQMVSHIGEHGIKSFTEQVEVLAKRYCPELLETREALDSRPLVP